MAYNSSEQKIFAPVSINSIKIALGNSSNDLGELCQAATINKFSRHKPVAYASVKPIGFGYGSETNEAETVGHGLTIEDVVHGNSGASSQQRAGYIEDAAANDWVYTKPSGGISQPFRMTDFNKYDHMAVPFIQVVYPQGGWQHIVGSTDDLVIHIDLDPGDEEYNLHTTDIINSAYIDLRSARVVAAIVYSGNYWIYSTTDTILDNDGEINVDSIIIPVTTIFSTMTGTFTCDVFMALQIGNDYYPLPKQGAYNPEHMYLKMIDDPKQSGAGVEDEGNDVELSPAYGVAFKPLADCADNFSTADFAMIAQGSLYVRIRLKNDSNQAKTVYRSDFTIQAGANAVFVPPSNMYNTDWAVISNSGLSVPAGGTSTAILFFDALFANTYSDFTRWSSVRQETLFFRRNGATLVDFDLNVRYGTDGWESY